MAEAVASFMIGASLAFAMFSDTAPARRLRHRVRNAVRAIFGDDRP